MIQRSKNLDEESIQIILSIIDGWTDKLSWGVLVSAVNTRLNQTYSRQALSNYPEILRAFQGRKIAIREGGASAPSTRLDSPELQVAVERIARLEAHNARLETERVALLDQFSRWAYNAFQRGLDLNILNQPLPRVDRDQTNKHPKRMKVQ